MKLKKALSTCCISLLLMSCGDGGGLQLSEGGITGSGISVGPITGFGSVWVGGVRYDTDNAEFIRNGKTAIGGQGEFHVGEIVSIDGDVNGDGITGIAYKIEFDRKLSGLVTAISADDNTLEILGQPVKTDALTLFTGFNSLNDLSLGNVLEVSGERSADGVLIASTLNRTGEQFTPGQTELEVEGNIAQVNTTNQTFKVGKLTISYGQSILNGVPDLQKALGEYIEIQSQQNLNNGQLTAELIELADEHPQLPTNINTSLEGRITQYNGGVFTVGGQTITVMDDTAIVHGSENDLGAGAHVSAQGFITEHGVMEAEEIVIRQSADPATALTLESTIEAIHADSSELVLLGNTIIVENTVTILDYSNGQAESITFAQLLPADRIRVTGRQLDSGKVLALRIDRNPVTTADDTGNSQGRAEDADGENEQPTDADSADSSNTEEIEPSDSPDASESSEEHTIVDGGDTTDEQSETTEFGPGEQADSDTEEDITGQADGTGEDSPEQTTDENSENNSGNGSGANQDDPTNNVKLKGTVSGIDSANRTLNIGDSQIITYDNTRFIGKPPENQELDTETFYDSLTANQTELMVEGQSLGDGWIVAIEIKVLKE